MSKRIKLVIITISIVVIGCLIFFYTRNKFTQTSVEKPLSTLTVVSLTEKCSIYVVVNPESIWFNPFETPACDSKPGLTIEKDQYPSLFKQGVADSSFISVEKDTNADSTLIISNNQPDHGSYSPAYQLGINVKTGEIREYKSNEFNCGWNQIKNSFIDTKKFDGILKPVDFSTNKDASQYKTVISEAVAKGANFAGHFTLATWGCGTDCVGYAVVDTETGKIIAYSGANGNYHLESLQLNNRVFILEPVYAGQERKFFKIVEDNSGSHLDLVCTEISTEDMYGSPE